MNVNRYKNIKILFEKNADEKDAKQMSAYMRNQFPFYGIKSPKRKKICSFLIREDKKKKQIDWEFLDKCYEDEHREFQYLVIDYLDALKGVLVYEDVFHILKYIKTKSWWDTIDSLCKTVGSLAFKDDRINDLLLKWSKDPNMWVRRTAIEHQLSRKEKTDTKLLAQILLNNFGSDEFFINKAIGWSLRDYSKTDPKWVDSFIEKYKDKMASLSIKEGSKYLHN